MRNNVPKTREITLVRKPDSIWFQAIVILGLSCCLYLGILKALNLPCALNGCDAITKSSYGSLWGISVAWYAVPLWLLLLSVSGKVRLILGFVLGFGSLGFMFIQFGLLKGFCLFCTVHALCAMTLTAFKGKYRAKWLSVVAACVLAILGCGIAYTSLEKAPQQVAIRQDNGYGWLGESNAKSPIILVSMQCSHCLDMLETALKHPKLGSSNVAKVYVFSQPVHRQDTILLLAGMLSSDKGDMSVKSFRDLFTKLPNWKSLALEYKSIELEQAVKRLYPDYSKYIALANQIHNKQAEFISKVNFDHTPLLIRFDGSGTYNIKMEDIFVP